MNKRMKRNIIIAAVALVLIGVLVAVILLIPAGGQNDTPGELDYGIDMTAGVNSDGLHTVTINTNEEGEIENNSYGTLVDCLPAQVVKVEMKSAEGNYTVLVDNPVNSDGTTEAATYTLEEFEGYNLAETSPALLVGDVCNIDFVKVADLSGDNAAEYGFDKPRAQATVYYDDDTYSVVIVGDDAPGASHCYVQFADSPTVYVVASDEVDSLFMELTDLFDTAINSDKTDVSDEAFDKIVLGGTHLDKEIIMEANTEGSLTCYYVLSSHDDRPVSSTEGSEVIGTIKSLATDAVVCVNPDKAQLKAFGLSKPYATVKTTYTYAETAYDSLGNQVEGETKSFKVSLLASEADSDGNVYLMEEGGKVVYSISADKVKWATTSLEKLVSEYVLYPSYSALESVVLEAKDKKYKFDLSTEEVKVTGEDGTTTTVDQPRVHLAGKEIDADQFYILFEDMAFMETAGEDKGTATTGAMLKITYNYTTDRKSDTVILYGTDTQKVIPEVNSLKNGYVYRSYVTSLIENIEKLAHGKEITDIQ